MSVYVEGFRLKNYKLLGIINLINKYHGISIDNFRKYAVALFSLKSFFFSLDHPVCRRHLQISAKISRSAAITFVASFVLCSFVGHNLVIARSIAITSFSLFPAHLN